jgi:hypothetical protein
LDIDGTDQRGEYKEHKGPPEEVRHYNFVIWSGCPAPMKVLSDRAVKQRA